ncbi:MAG: hypothetical protein KBG20_12200 [Caldilineaceae bacterium]|nr:hypothetical protein [Caldilineaceae bacterium]MBP8109256.1 hypothetical protein [Caldilineaceae bacterium]MBP8122936.1 hypothetical protein [Caldilineaceae bacterium]MBP9073060.1 hypothetical protein [Caldilineaceae bacterium]
MAQAQMTAAPLPGQSKGRFGTFGGVFTPNVLTILGIILFLRSGWVVGQAGLTNALIIVAIANSISLLTGLSLAAIATNMNVRAGGNYYIISRTLGLEIGGAIGIPLYLSQATSIAFYIIGFTEALQTVAYFQAFDPRMIATAVALVFAVIAYVGADFAIKIQYFILAVLGAALISFFAGGWGEAITPTWTANYTPGVTFWIVFAVFFPAVTGIEVGTSMSGDLKNPSRSIPVGTIASILVTAVIYFVAVYWFGTHATVDNLVNDNMVMQGIARWPVLILAGVWAATLSSALGSILAAPRTLQAIAKDRVVPKVLANTLGSATEPRVAVLVSAAIAIAVIWAGDLNVVAPIISMFFLNTYGMTNLVAGIEKMVGNPSFRPRFNIHWSISILGALGCYGAMFLINPLATVLAIVISYGIYFYLERRSVSRTWGDLRSGIWFALARRALLNLEQHRFHAKNWRPNILVFTGQPHNREELVSLSEWLSIGRGMVSFNQLIVGDVEKLTGQGLRRTARRQIRAYIKDRRMTAFAEADVVNDFYHGALTVAQAHGVSGLEPNTIMIGWSRTQDGRTMQMRLLHNLVRLDKSVLFVHFDETAEYGRHKIINVWWGGRSDNADLIMLLAHLISRHPTWDGVKIRLLRIINSEEGRAQTQAHMQELLTRVRVEAEPIALVKETPGQPVMEIITKWSKDADLTLLGMDDPEPAKAEEYANRLNDLISAVGTTLLVRSGHHDELLETDA